MSKKIITFALGTIIFALCFPAWAQQPKKVPRIGYLALSAAPTNPRRADAFRQGLRQLGYAGEKTLSLSIDMPREK